MRIRADFPRRVRELPNVRIPLADGVRLAARIWLPEDAERDPVPAILEYLPYRKGDFTAVRDALRHPWFAGHGYASVRVDLRGSGDSEGLLRDEYHAREQDDALEVLAWLAAQPWCTGKVGMIGKSWGGFNGLQVAARRPAELAAVISVDSTDDRYEDDVHYVGGCVLAMDMLGWATALLAYTARPPDPAAVGRRWRELWRERLEETSPFAETWLSHQRRDAYWRHGSVCEDYGAIACPVYLVGGWADPYRNAVLRLLEGLTCPRKGLIGPWSHAYPDEASPGPAIGFNQECLRWWDQWLKGIETGVMDEPMLRAWLQEWAPPQARYDTRPGRWIAEERWPSPRLETQVLALGDGVLGKARARSAPGRPLRISWDALVGLDGGAWIPFGNEGELPPDQRAEDGRSLCFTSPPLEEPLEILGFPEVALALAVDRPLALVCARLCDVAPDGSSLLVTRGVLNLAHRESHEQPAPLEPGRRYAVAVRLNAIAHSFAVGHRLRLAVSPGYWPWAWPSPSPVTLSVFPAESGLLLLVRAARPEDAALPSLQEPEVAPPLAVEVIEEPRYGRVARRDLGAGAIELTTVASRGRRRLVAAGLELHDVSRDVYSLVEGDPLSARAESRMEIEIARDGWQTRVEAYTALTSDARSFVIASSLAAFEGAARVFARSWRRSVPRDLV